VEAAMNSKNLSNIAAYLVAVLGLGFVWTLAISLQVANAQGVPVPPGVPPGGGWTRPRPSPTLPEPTIEQDMTSAQTPQSPTLPEPVKVELDLTMEKFLPSSQDQKFRSAMWELYGKVEPEAKGFAVWNNWKKIGCISTNKEGRAAWSLDRETKVANLDILDNSADKGALSYELFRSAFHESPLWRDPTNRAWEEAFCNAFRYFMEAKLTPDSPWLATVNKRMAEGVNLKNKTPNPDLILFCCGKDYDRFKKLWKERQLRRNDSLDDFFTMQYTETYFLGVDFGPLRPTYPQDPTTLQKIEADSAAEKYRHSFIGKTVKVRGIVTDVERRMVAPVLPVGPEAEASIVSLSFPKMPGLVVHFPIPVSWGPKVKKGDFVSCSSTISRIDGLYQGSEVKRWEVEIAGAKWTLKPQE
jgi:hypothetical protein